MRRYSLLAAVSGLLLAADVMAAPPNNGFIGVFGDAAGTNCCVSMGPSGNGRLYLFAVTAGASAAGLTAAEFRVSIEPADAGATFNWNPAFGATSVGNPTDNGSGGGVSVSFSSCRTVTGQAGDKIELGSIAVTHLVGPHTVVVRPHSTPSANFACPSMLLCDGPATTRVCLTLEEGDPALEGQEPMSFTTSVNDPACSGVSCGFVAVEATQWTTIKRLYN